MHVPALVISAPIFLLVHCHRHYKECTYVHGGFAPGAHHRGGARAPLVPHDGELPQRGVDVEVDALAACRALRTLTLAWARTTEAERVRCWCRAMASCRRAE